MRASFCSRVLPQTKFSKIATKQTQYLSLLDLSKLFMNTDSALFTKNISMP